MDTRQRQVAENNISFERLLSLAHDETFIDPTTSDERVLIVSEFDLPLHYKDVQQCVLGVRLSLGNVPRVSSLLHSPSLDFSL